MNEFRGIIGIGLIVLAAACGQDAGQENGITAANGTAGGSEIPPAEPSSHSQPERAAIHVGDKTLNAPSDFQMAVAFYQIIGLEPPFDAWARSDPRAASANEFDRPAVAARVQEELLLAARSVAGVGFVELNTSSNFGEYDMASQGFRLEAIDSDRFWTWDYKGGRYKLTMDNGNEAQLWKIPADEARSLVESMSYRNVDLKLRIKIVGAMPEGSGGTLQGQIVGYQVLNDDGRKVGEMSF
jgi:hypothetical protein